MSRSRRKTPFCSWAVVKAGEEKDWKRRASQSMRHKVVSILKTVGIEDDVDMPNKHEIVNQYSDPKDGKQRFDPKKFPRGMRK